MAIKHQLLEVKLKERRLYVQRVNNKGRLAGKVEKWNIGKNSNVPREIFFKTKGFIASRIRRSGTRSMKDMLRGVRHALEQAGGACGCQIKKGSKHADLYWLRNGRPLFAWQIHEDVLDKRRAKNILKSRAMLRLAVVVEGSGFFKITPLRARPK